MTLPTFAVPTIDIKIPSLGKTVPFRAYLVSEEKLLLMAHQSGELADILRAITAVAQACCQDKSVDIAKLCDFDVEYIFLKLRGFSVNDVINVKYALGPGEVIDLTFKTDEVEMVMPTDLNSIVFTDQTKTAGLNLRWPSALEVASFEDPTLTPEERLDKIAIACIDEVFTSEDMFKFSDYSYEERTKFFDHLRIPVLKEIQDYFDAMPILQHTITYRLKDKTEHSITISGIRDFFSWG